MHSLLLSDAIAFFCSTARPDMPRQPTPTQLLRPPEALRGGEEIHRCDVEGGAAVCAHRCEGSKGDFPMVERS